MSLVEILNNAPIWLYTSHRLVLVTGDRLKMTQGLVGNKTRSLDQIIKVQEKLVGNLKSTLNKTDNYGLYRDDDFMDLLGKMLEFDPQNRISPSDIL